MNGVKNIDLEHILRMLGYRGEGDCGYEWYQAYNTLISILEEVGILTECNVDSIISILDVINIGD